MSSNTEHSTTGNSTNGQRAWLLRLAHRKKESLSADVVGIGWTKAKGLAEVKDWAVFKEIIRNAYPNVYGHSAHALGNASGSIWRFIHEINLDDLILVPTSNGFFVARCKSAVVYYHESGIEQDFAWRRDVQWFHTTPRSRDFADNALQRRMKARQTCIEVTDLLGEIRTALQRKQPLNFYSEAVRQVQGPLSDVLREAVNDRGLEEVVRGLAAASGATTRILPKKQVEKGDVDVEAVYDLRIATQESTVKVGYQVKQHEGESDESAVQQLIPKLELGEIDRGCVVSTADVFTKEAEELAELHEILLISRSELVEWLMSVGIGELAPAEGE